MKKVSLLLTLLFSINIYTTQGQPPIIIESPGFYIDELTLQDWNGNWKNSNVYKYSHDAQGRKTGTVFYSWISNQWVKSDTIIQSYNADNTVNIKLNQKWNGSSWNNYERYQYTYNSEGKVLTEEVDLWNGTTWLDSAVNTTTYDLDNHISTYLQEEWEGTTWENKRKKTYTVNIDGSIAQKLEEYWGTGWTFSTRNAYTYVDGNVTEEQVELHDGTTWNLYTKFTLTYDNDLLTSSLTQHWNGNITAWVDDRRFSHTYNADGSINYSVNQEWTAGGWINLAKFSYTYTLLTKNIPPETSAIASISPNPFTETIQIELSEESLPAELKLCDQQGKMVRRFILNLPTSTIPLENLTAGSYYACITAGDKIIYKKLIKIE